MARKGITYNQVFASAEAIKARGIAPTISAVRNELGEGSFTTISQHLQKWKLETADHADLQTLPQEVEEKALETITVLWNIAVREASNDIKAIKQEYTDKEIILKEELKQHIEEIIQLEKQVQKLELEKEKAEEKTKTEEAKTHQLEVKLSQKEGELTAYKNIKPKPPMKATNKTTATPEKKPL